MMGASQLRNPLTRHGAWGLPFARDELAPCRRKSELLAQFQPDWCLDKYPDSRQKACGGFFFWFDDNGQYRPVSGSRIQTGGDDAELARRSFFNQKRFALGWLV